MYERVTAGVELLCRLLGTVCNLMLAVMTGVIATLVISRNLFNYSPPWSEEITRYLLVWMTMMGAAVLLWRGDHIRLDLVNQRFPPKVQFYLSIALRILVLAFAVILTHQSWFAALARSATRAPATGLNLFWPYLALPIGGALMVLITLVGLWGDFRSIAGHPPAKKAP